MEKASALFTNNDPTHTADKTFKVNFILTGQGKLYFLENVKVVITLLVGEK